MLRDESEAFAAKLGAAAVPVVQLRYGGIIHDFATVNSLQDTPTTKLAVAQAVAVLREVLQPE